MNALQTTAQALLAAADAYEEECRLHGLEPSLLWVDDDRGRTVVIVGTQLRDLILLNVAALAVPARMHQMITGNEEGPPGPSVALLDRPVDPVAHGPQLAAE